jgi:hypothetical protein
MAAVSSAAVLTEVPVVRTIAAFFIQMAVVFIVAGGAAAYLSRLRGPLMPNERPVTSNVPRPPLGGWLMALAVALVALPVWLITRLQPLFEGWAQVIDYLATWDWSGASTSGAGLVLLPVAGALTPPAFQLGAAVFVVAASALLLVCLLSRSQRFPRIYVVCLVLSGALVFAGVRSAAAAAAAGNAVEQLIQDTANAQETAQLTEGLQRYTSIVGSTAPVLMWTLCGYVVWLPPLLFSRRATVTFARNSEAHIAGLARATDIEAITSPPA